MYTHSYIIVGGGRDGISEVSWLTQLAKSTSYGSTWEILPQYIRWQAIEEDTRCHLPVATYTFTKVRAQLHAYSHIYEDAYTHTCPPHTHRRKRKMKGKWVEGNKRGREQRSIHPQKTAVGMFIEALFIIAITREKCHKWKLKNCYSAQSIRWTESLISTIWKKLLKLLLQKLPDTNGCKPFTWDSQIGRINNGKIWQTTVEPADRELFGLGTRT